METKFYEPTPKIETLPKIEGMTPEEIAAFMLNTFNPHEIEEALVHMLWNMSQTNRCRILARAITPPLQTV